MLFLLAFAPEAIPPAIAFCTAISTLVVRVGIIYGPRVVDLIDVLFADGLAMGGTGGAVGMGVARLEPAVLDRLAKQFHDLPNARHTITIAHGLVQDALVHGKLYGKEIKAVADAALHHKWVPAKVTEAIRAAAKGGIKPVQTLKSAGGHGSHHGHIPVEGTPGIVETGRDTAMSNAAYLKELHKARQGGRSGGGGII